MDRLRIRGNWNEVKGKVKEHWGNLTDDDLQYQEGKDDQLVGRIQEKTGESRERIVDYINNL